MHTAVYYILASFFIYNFSVSYWMIKVDTFILLLQKSHKHLKNKPSNKKIFYIDPLLWIIQCLLKRKILLLFYERKEKGGTRKGEGGEGGGVKGQLTHLPHNSDAPESIFGKGAE